MSASAFRSSRRLSTSVDHQCSASEIREGISKFTEMGLKEIPTALTSETRRLIRDLLMAYNRSQLGSFDPLPFSCSRLWQIWCQSVQRTARNPVLRWAFLNVMALLPILIASMALFNQETALLKVKSNGGIAPLPPEPSTNTTTSQFVGASDTNAYSFLLTTLVAWLGLAALTHICSAYDMLKERWGRDFFAGINIAIRAALLSAALWLGYYFATENSLERTDLKISFILSVVLGSLGATFLAVGRSNLVNPRATSERLRWWSHILKMAYWMLIQYAVLMAYSTPATDWCGSFLAKDPTHVFAHLPIFHHYARVGLFSTLPFSALFLLAGLGYFMAQVRKTYQGQESSRSGPLPRVPVSEGAERPLISPKPSIFEEPLLKWLRLAEAFEDFQLSAHHYKSLSFLLEGAGRATRGRLNHLLSSPRVHEFLFLLVNGIFAGMMWAISQEILKEEAVYQGTADRKDCTEQTQRECDEGDYVTCEPLLRAPEQGPFRILSILIFKQLATQVFHLLADLCHRAHQKYAGFKGGALSGGFGAVFGLLLGGSISAALFDNMVSLKTGIIVGLGIGLAVGISLFILIAGFHLKRQNMSLLHPHSSWWTVIAVLSALALIRWNLPTAVSVIDTRAPDAPPDLENLFTMRRDLLIPLIAQSFMCTLLSVAGLQAVWSILEMRCVPEDSKMKPASTIVFNPGYESFNEDTEEEEEALYTRVLPRIRSRLQLTTNDVYGQGETRTEPPSMSTFGFGQRRATGIFHIRAPSDEESDEEKGGSPLYDQALLRSGSNSPVYEQPAMMQARIVAQQEEEEALGTHPFYQLAQPVNSSDGSGDEAGSESSAEA